MTHFNTTNLHSDELKEAWAKCSSREFKIFEFFKKNHDRNFTPCEVSKKFKKHPITSIRRAITNLTTKGLLQKLTEKREGMYGVGNYCWRLIVSLRPIDSPKQETLF